MNAPEKIPAPPADLPPDPAAAKSAALAARRWLVISYWPLLLYAGAFSALAAIPMFVWPGSHRVHGIAGLVWVGAVLIPVALWPVMAKRFMPGPGHARSVLRGIDWSQVARSVVTQFLICIPWIAANVALTLDITSRTYWTLICAYLFLGFMVMALVHHLWDFMLVSAIAAAMGAYLLAFPVPMLERQRAMFVAISLAGLLLGLTFVIRWRRWVRSLPPEEANS